MCGRVCARVLRVLLCVCVRVYMCVRARLSNETRRWAWAPREERGGGVSGGFLAGYALENTDRVCVSSK